MTESESALSAATAPGPGLLARIVGVFTSPKATFEGIVPAPKVAGILAVVSLATGLSTGAFLMTPRGQQAWLDMQAQNSEKFSGQPLSEQQAAAFEKIVPYVGYFTIAGSLPVVPLIMVIEAGILFAIFTFGSGGTATFKQILSVTAHSSVIGTLGLIFGVIIQFARGTISMTGPANAGVLLPMLPENGWLAQFLGLVDLFRVWWVITLSIGLGVLYKRNSRNIALTLFALYGVIIGCVAWYLSSR